MRIRHPANLLALVACALLLSGHATAQEAAEETAEEKTCLSGSHGEAAAEKTVCVVEKFVEYQPGEGDYARAVWVLQYADGSPVEEEKEVHFATLIWLPNPPAPGMPPLDVTYLEKVGEEGRVVFGSPDDWSDRRMAISVDKLINDTIQYVGDGDELIIEADR